MPRPDPSLSTSEQPKRLRTRRSRTTMQTDESEERLLDAHVTPALKGWLLWDGEFVMGPRYVKLLEGIERHGSIRAACADLGLSYRTCLTRIRRMERVTGASIVVTQRGGSARGGAEVTPLGRRLVRAYRVWRDEMERASRSAFERAMAD
jgi:N-terminal domain of molybdenum-binding protein